MTKIRYAVVGAGWIAQEAFMPAVAQTGNSEMTAIVTGNADAAATLAEFYGIGTVCGYDGYDDLLASGTVDAVYIGLPNSLHADYAIRAARAGVHAMVEKPLALTAEECRAMIAAHDAAGTFLMTAYRLHNEPGTLEVLEQIRRGSIGAPRFFHAAFSFQIAAGNHRLKAEHWGGPLQDLGVYCVNAARHVFGTEPVEAVAMQSLGTDARFGEVPEMVTAILRFPGGGMASFTTSFGAEETARYAITGTTGEIVLDPGFRFEHVMRMDLRNGAETKATTFPSIDHFGAQTAYFSDCIRTGEPPEADGAEGLADVVILRAIEAAAETGRAQAIDLPPRPRHPTPDMVRLVPRTDRRLLL